MGRVREAAGYGFAIALGLSAIACGSSGSGGSSGTSDVTINELLPSNQTTAVDEAGEADDWIELYNAGSVDVDLAGYFITDDSTAIKKFTFPTNAVVPAAGVLLLWADGADQVTQGPLHVGFKLNATQGDRVILSDPEGYVVDEIQFGTPTGAQYSFARHPDGTGEFAWCATATPGKLNGSTCQ